MVPLEGVGDVRKVSLLVYNGPLSGHIMLAKVALPFESVDRVEGDQPGKEVLMTPRQGARRQPVSEPAKKEASKKKQGD